MVLPANVASFGAGARLAFFKQVGHVVGGGDARKAARGGERGVAVAGGHVEHGLVGADVGGFGEGLADAQDGLQLVGQRGEDLLVDEGVRLGQQLGVAAVVVPGGQAGVGHLNDAGQHDGRGLVFQLE